MNKKPAAQRALRVLVADDHESVLRETCELLASEFEIVGAVSDGISLLSSARDCLPDVVVSDFRMPGLDGIAAGRQLLEQQLCRAVVLLTMFADTEVADAARRAGICGYVVKTNAGNELIPAVWRAAAGDEYPL